MLSVPAALVDGRKLARKLAVSGGGPWYLAGPGTFYRVGSGDLSYADLRAVGPELTERVLVALPRLSSLQEYLGGAGKAQSTRPLDAHRSGMGIRARLHRYEQVRDGIPPTVNAVARAAQVAVLPDLGPVWVDSRRLFRPGEKTSLPWTEPHVELPVVRPSQVRSAMREAIGRGGPRRASEPVSS
jgi:hypothetical protein